MSTPSATPQSALPPSGVPAVAPGVSSTTAGAGSTMPDPMLAAAIIQVHAAITQLIAALTARDLTGAVGGGGVGGLLVGIEGAHAGGLTITSGSTRGQIAITPGIVAPDMTITPGVVTPIMAQPPAPPTR